MHEDKPALFRFSAKKRAWARWLVCSWKDHKFVEMVMLQNGVKIPAPLPCCERCGIVNPNIIFASRGEK